jgi:hypothetical protein
MQNPDGTWGKPKFGGTFIFDKRGQELTAKAGMNFGAHVGELVKEINLFASRRWPDEFKEAEQPFLWNSKLKSPWLNPKDPKYRDRPEMKEATTFIRPTSQRLVPCCGLDPEHKITNQEDIYPGCYVRVYLAVYNYSNTGNHGPGFGLRAVQFAAHGDRLDGGIDVSKAFGSLEDPAEAAAFGALGATAAPGVDQAAALAAMFGAAA